MKITVDDLMAASGRGLRYNEGKLRLKQTAVEWLLEQYIEKQAITPDIIEQAKEMEKEQIINAFDTGHRIGEWNFLGEEYYEKTFKNDKE